MIFFVHRALRFKVLNCQVKNLASCMSLQIDHVWLKTGEDEVLVPAYHQSLFAAIWSLLFRAGRQNPRVHFVDRVAQKMDVLHAVARDHDRLALGFEVEQKLADVLDAAVVETVHRFVEQENVWIFHDGLRDAQALAHTEAVFADVFLAFRVEADAAQRVENLLLADFVPASRERFLKPEYAGRKPGASMMTPIFGGMSTSLPTRLPWTRISPDVGRMKPQMHFMRTVLPEPLRPMSP